MPGQSAVTLTEQILQLRQFGSRALALRIFRGHLEQLRQMALGIAVPSQLQVVARSGALQLEIRVAGVILESLFVHEEDLFATKPVAVSLFDDLRETFPCGPILAPQTEVLAQRLLGLFQVVAGLGAVKTAQQGRRVPPDLHAVHEVHTPAEHGHGREQDRQKYQVESSHDHDQLE